MKEVSSSTYIIFLYLLYLHPLLGTPFNFLISEQTFDKKLVVVLIVHNYDHASVSTSFLVDSIKREKNGAGREIKRAIRKQQPRLDCFEKSVCSMGKTWSTSRLIPAPGG